MTEVKNGKSFTSREIEWTKALYLNFKVFIRKILTGNTILRDHPRATRRSTRLRGEESTFFSQLL